MLLFSTGMSSFIMFRGGGSSLVDFDSSISLGSIFYTTRVCLSSSAITGAICN